MKKEGGILFCYFLIFICLIGFVNAGQTTTDSNGVTTTTDDLGRIVYREYPADVNGNSGTVITYDYYDTSTDIQKLTINHGEEIQTYDPKGNILSDVFASDSQKNIYYTYWANGNLSTIQKNGVWLIFSYDSNYRITKQTQSIPSKGIQVVIVYDFDDKGRLKFIGTPKVEYNYTYYDYEPLKDLLDTVYTKTLFKDGSFKNSFLRYYYDTKGNIVSKVNDQGINVSYTYRDFSYPCENIVCDDADCITYHTESQTCTYSQQDKRTMNNYVVQTNYMDDGTIKNSSLLGKNGQVVETYAPTESYSSEGLLKETDQYLFGYSDDNFLNQITNLATGTIVTPSYNSEGQLASLTYSDNGEKEQFFYDPLGSLVLNEDRLKGVVTSSIGTGAVISNFFFNMFATITGHAVTGRAVDEGVVENSDGSFTYSYVSSLGEGDYVPLGEYNNLLDRFEIEYGRIPSPSDKEFVQCRDFDNGVSEYDASFVSYNHEYFFDSCISSGVLDEYYCGGTFGIGSSVRDREITCQYGCYSGSCLERPLEDIITSVPQTDIVVNEPMDLPDEPGQLGGNV